MLVQVNSTKITRTAAEHTIRTAQSQKRTSTTVARSRLSDVLGRKLGKILLVIKKLVISYWS
jgi:hypothetical protein